MMLRRHMTLIGTAILGSLVLVAAGLEGPARFTGLRWALDLGAAPLRSPEPEPTLTPEPTLPPVAPPLTESGPAIALPAEVIQGAIWLLVAIAVTLLVLLIWKWIAQRPSRATLGLLDSGRPTSAAFEVPRDGGTEAELDVPPLRRGIEQALVLLDGEREPADAILKAWLGLETTAEESGIQRISSETPTEFTTRILRRVSTDDKAIRTLLRLYLRARFGDHPVTAADVGEARLALEGLMSTWGAER